MTKRQSTQLFVRVPKVLLGDNNFTLEECVLYAFLLDKRELSESTSRKPETFMKFVDEEGIFCYTSIDEICKVLRCGKNKAIDTKKALAKKGLIKEKRRIEGSNKIHVYDVQSSIEISEF